MVASFFVAGGCSSNLTACDPLKSNYKLAMILYTLNFAGDLVDGMAARAMNQCSKYGGVLDMVTDRVSTAGLTALLAILYPGEAFIFISLMILDIFSHWFHVVYAEVAQRHHKGEQTNVFLKWYYGCYPLFAYCCVSQELYYLGRWALKFMHQDGSLSDYAYLVELTARWIFLPGCTLKQVVNLAQWWNAAGNLAKNDREVASKKS